MTPSLPLSPSGQPSVEWFGVTIMEPMVTFTDLWISAVSVFALLRLRKLGLKGAVYRYMVWYFLLMGIATFLGGLLGHAFQHVVGIQWKLAGWLISMLSVSAIERATIFYVKPLISHRLARFLEMANLLELLVFMVITFATLDFFYVKVHSAYGLAVIVLPLHTLAWWKTRNPGSRIIALSVCFASIAAVTYTTRIGFHTWFNHLDVSHTVMAISLYFFYRGTRKLRTFTHQDVLPEPGDFWEAIGDAVRPRRKPLRGPSGSRTLIIFAAGWLAGLAAVGSMAAAMPEGRAIAQARLDRIEPANWWIGMKHSQVQVLLYGRELGTLEPRLEHPGVRITDVTRVQNPNYLFVTLAVGDDAAPGEIAIGLHSAIGASGSNVANDANGASGSNGAKEDPELTAFFRLDERRPGAAGIRGFDPSDAMLLITPDRFANGDPSNDWVDGLSEGPNRADREGRHGGDLRGILDHLDYIDEMGFTAIWLNPVVENAMPRTSYHGYAATDFYKVDPRFGTNEEYLELIDQARARGIGMVMDMIMNHSGSEHWFVKDPPTADWINFGGRYVNTSHHRQTVQDPYASDYDRRMFSDGWFVETMPDLNQRQPLMATYLIQNTLWWIETAGLAGIRMDTYPYPDPDFMTDWTCAVMREYPDFSVVGEEWSMNPARVAYWQQGARNADGYTSCLTHVMDFPLQDALSKALTEPEVWNKGWMTAYDMLANDFLYADATRLVIFPDNHDMDRFFTQVENDLDLFRMGMVHTLTMRGTPQLYYGTEILMENNRARNDHGIIRTDFPGGWSGDRVDAFTGEGLTADQLEAQAFVKRMLNWRKQAQVIHEGRLMQFAPYDGIYSYVRYRGGDQPAVDSGPDRVLVVFNKNERAVEVALDRYAEVLGGIAMGGVFDVVSGARVDVADGRLELPARGVRVLEWP
jgi:glycosidase